MIQSLGAWAPAGAAFGAGILAVVALALLWEWWAERRRGKDVVEQLRSFAAQSGTDRASETLMRSAKIVEARWIRPLAARVPHLRDLANTLAQAGVRWSPQTYLLITLGAAVVLGLGALALLRLWVAALVAASGGACLPYLYLQWRKTRFIRAFEEQLPEAIDLLGRAIRAGHPLSAGLKMAAEEATEPIAGELRRVFEEQRFGIPFDDALMGLADRIDLVDVRILVTAIMVQREVGGNLAEVLDKIAHTVRARFTIRRQVRVYTAQGRFSGYVLAVLPIAVGCAIFLVNRQYILILIQDHLGRWLLLTGAVLQILGFIWIRRIVNIEI
ncbi:MAG TPA: type II secretion system F family protein [Gemmatimonadales bacterium]|nr:type II secretion system F family protein [Gemmatimonadales bacterium]